MSAGISRSRLMEERKQWRKDHPHVNNKRNSVKRQCTQILFIGILGTTWKKRRQFTRFDELDLRYSWKRRCKENIERKGMNEILSRVYLL